MRDRVRVPGEGVPLRPSTTDERTWEARIVPSAATPVAMPTWRSVELIPDAIPARAGSTTPTAVETSGTLTKPGADAADDHPGQQVRPVRGRRQAAHQQQARRRSATNPGAISIRRGTRS